MMCQKNQEGKNFVEEFISVRNTVTKNIDELCAKSDRLDTLRLKFSNFSPEVQEEIAKHLA